MFVTYKHQKREGESTNLFFIYNTLYIDTTYLTGRLYDDTLNFLNFRYYDFGSYTIRLMTSKYTIKYRNGV